jgi:hypothetical protein
VNKKSNSVENYDDDDDLIEYLEDYKERVKVRLKDVTRDLYKESEG